MSVHSYSRCWLHLIWTTLNRERMLFGDKAMKVSAFLSEYAESKGIYMKINYVNPEHVHALHDQTLRPRMAWGRNRLNGYQLFL